jgi:hypothetical protein
MRWCRPGACWHRPSSACICRRMILPDRARFAVARAGPAPCQPRRDQQVRALPRARQPGRGGAALVATPRRPRRNSSQSLAILDRMALPANWAFEGYANVPEVALALAANPQSRAGRTAPPPCSAPATPTRSCASLPAPIASPEPRTLIFAGILAVAARAHGRRRSGAGRKAAALAELICRCATTLARAHFEIGRHLAAGETWDGHDAIYYLEQARAEFAKVGAGYMLARVERLCSIDEDATQPG